MTPTPGPRARRLQEHLASQVSRRNEAPTVPSYVAGIDISGQDAQGCVQGAVVVLRWPGMELAEVQVGQGVPTLPYIPGLLAFREVPMILDALERLSITPDLILVDGQGLAHPRRFGIACHIGLLTQLPTVGCAKSILRGRHGLLEPQQGAWVELVDKGEVVGAAVRSKANTSPTYVSVGHKVDLASAVQLVLSCCQGYRLPEPTRKAHLAAGGHLREWVSAPALEAAPKQGVLL